MDEGLLNDLLECSVCLERLDTSSRVLPCQHTFCLKCLKEIVDSHKELRCPECRVLVEAKVEELPPNVLLMRILEGMRNSAPRKLTVTGQRSSRSGHSHQASLQGSHGHQVVRGSADGKQLPPHGRAMHDYLAKEPGDLSFMKGEVVLLLKKLDPFWFQGECNGRKGVFPITYVQVIVPLQVPSALCKALYDFRMSAPDEEGCLAFDKGAIISVHRRVDENWAEGRLEDRVGIFPIAFVELNQAARQLMNSPSLNRPVPPLPDHARPGHSDHRHHSQHSHRYQQMSMSTPTTGQQMNYQNIATMSQSHPNYHPTHSPRASVVQPQSQVSIPQSAGHVSAISHGGVVTTAAIPRNIVEPTHNKNSIDLIHFTNVHNKVQGTVGPQSVSARIGEPFDNRLGAVKYESYNSTPLHRKADAAYRSVRAHDAADHAGSDSSSSANTPGGVSSTTTPNSSSNTSSCESAEPSSPSSPDDGEDAAPPRDDADASLDASLGVVSLNESSTATNTSLNVTLPAESPEAHAGARGRGAPLDFGLGLQAALSPAHGKMAPRPLRDARHREKRDSLTRPHLQHASQNRHSAEIVATSLLDAGAGAGGVAGGVAGGGAAGAGRRRRSRSSERALPAAYVALYPYRPQKPDELELRKGGIYMVMEKCRDGWYKGCSERTQRCGVFPGNYVAAASASARPKHDKQMVVGVSGTAMPGAARPEPAPDAPPRAHTPPHTHAQPVTYSWSGGAAPQQAKVEKPKEKAKQDKASSGVSLMKRLAAMKKCKSPPPAGYSMDNPVFEDGPCTSLMLTVPSSGQPQHPVHVRSGSCPSQLLRALPAAAERRARAAEPAHAPRAPKPRSNENPWQTQHRKSQSLDVTATRRERGHHSQPIKERFRCIVPYPPNSEYELELKVDDIVLVHRKRGDGWYKGTLQRTGRTGLFPASFVQSCPAAAD